MRKAGAVGAFLRKTFGRRGRCPRNLIVPYRVRPTQVEQR